MALNCRAPESRPTFTYTARPHVSRNFFLVLCGDTVNFRFLISKISSMLPECFKARFEWIQLKTTEEFSLEENRGVDQEDDIAFRDVLDRDKLYREVEWYPNSALLESPR